VEVDEEPDGPGDEIDNSGSGSSGDGDDEELDDDDDRSGSGDGDDDEDDDEDIVQQRLTGAIELAQDDSGREYLAGEVLFAGSAVDLDRAEDAGFRVIASQQLDVPGHRLARLLVPPRRSVRRSLVDLRRLAPGALVTVNTAYRNSQVGVSGPGSSNSRVRPRANAIVGVIDTGAAPEVTGQALEQSRGFGPEGYRPRPHGSAVAAIVVANGARVQMADVFGQTPTGEAVAPASAIIAALQWMQDSDVAVVNISIEGPRNEILEEMVRRAAQRGHLIVAAAGNGGPLADPVYPGAYDGVIAVTAVDSGGRAYLRANRGSYVDFAALGVDVPVATEQGMSTVSGTSFAAPIVAAKLAERLHQPSPRGAADAVQALQRTAIDRGRPGRDPVYGWGEVQPN
jgi:hypothetical protein